MKTLDHPKAKLYKLFTNNMNILPEIKDIFAWIDGSAGYNIVIFVIFFLL